MFTLPRPFRVFLIHTFSFAVLLFATGVVQAQDEEPLEKIETDKAIEEFYDAKDRTVVNFDKDPAGVMTKTKQKLNDLYVSKGVSFSAEAGDSDVWAYRYHCGGISGDKCAGNSRPPYGGIMRITFHAPDDADTKATVTEFGMYLSAVKATGTTVEAYDVDDKLIGSIVTTKGNSEFLGAKSKTPIHYLRIVPNEMVDPDFAMDDLAFTPPKKVD